MQVPFVGAVEPELHIPAKKEERPVRLRNHYSPASLHLDPGQSSLSHCRKTSIELTRGKRRAGRAFPPPWTVETRSRRSAKTFTPGSFVKYENPAGEWPGARGHHEEPLIHCPRHGCARGCRHAGSHEQRLQEQPTCVVRSDVQLAAPHKNWPQLNSGD